MAVDPVLMSLRTKVKKEDAFITFVRSAAPPPLQPLTDRTIHKAFRRKVQYRIRADLTEQVTDCRFVANIGCYEGVTRIPAYCHERIEFAGIGQFVDPDHLGICLPDQLFPSKASERVSSNSLAFHVK